MNSTLTVTTAATDTTLLNIAVARGVLGIDGRGQDAALQAYIARASDVIARRCKRVFGSETVSEQFRLDTLQEELILNRYPVTGTPTVVENGITLTASTDYEADKAKGWITRLYNDRPCWWPICKVTVSYTAGYTLPTGAPQALQQACLQLVRAYFFASDRDPAVRSDSVHDVADITYRDIEHLPHDVSGLLVPFRNLRAV